MGKFNLQDIIHTFFQESREMLEDMELCLLSVEKNCEDVESINAIFRAIHTIKGSSGMFGLEAIERFTHKVENVLDDVRKGILPADEQMTTLMLSCHDHINQLLDLFESDNHAELPEDLLAQQNDLFDGLAKLSGQTEQKAETVETDTNKKELTPPVNTMKVRNECWHVSIRFHEDLFKHALDPKSVINYLKDFGEIFSIKVIGDSSLDFMEYDPENCYLGFEIDLRVDREDITRETIYHAFDFVKDDAELTIIPPNSSITEYVDLINNLPEESMQIGEILTLIGSLTSDELEEALSAQNASAEMEETSKEKIGEILVDQKKVHKPVVDAALHKQKEIRKKEETRQKSLRIDADKLDILINQVGELVITVANVKELSEKIQDGELVESVLTMLRLIEEVRDSSMTLRMVQIGETFRRFERVIRDLSRQSGKEVELTISGGDTELDKTLVEKINDPLMHLVRNSVDHGIETPEVRAEAGKDPVGSIHLNAYHETGSIVIEVADDGGGLNREKIYAKAVSNGRLQEGQTITDQELQQLIFEPGLSTAEKVTNISGRGVGMDVVKRNIESLRGTILIDSKEGVGTKIRIHLPLTLAIIDGFMVSVGDARYVVPLDMVIECTEISSEDMVATKSSNMMNFRGEPLPVMHLSEFFGLEEDHDQKENVIIVEYARKKAGLIVNKLIGEYQTVIKPMGKLFHDLHWLSGATILGTGEVAFILDIAMLLKTIQQNEHQSVKAVSL